VIPVFVLDPETEAIGAAPKWRLGLSVADLRRRLRAMGSDLILRRGPAPDTLLALAAETRAGTVRWTRLHHPAWAARDEAAATALATAGIEAVGHPGQLVNEPGAVRTKTGGCFKIFTPFWRAAFRLARPSRCRRPRACPRPKRGPPRTGLRTGVSAPRWTAARRWSRRMSG
jgi:deoxyribodipyrimidine photo-lyase